MYLPKMFIWETSNSRNIKVIVCSIFLRNIIQHQLWFFIVMLIFMLMSILIPSLKEFKMNFKWYKCWSEYMFCQYTGNTRHWSIGKGSESPKQIYCIQKEIGCAAHWSMHAINVALCICYLYCICISTLWYCWNYTWRQRFIVKAKGIKYSSMA